MKAKHNIGQILKYITPNGSNISKITSIKFYTDKVEYCFDEEQLHCEEKDVLESYTQVKTRAKRSSKKKVIVNSTEI